MDDEQIKVLNNIVAKNGDCLTSELCNRCPFKRKCLPEFLQAHTLPSRKERYEMASDKLARISLLLDES